MVGEKFESDNAYGATDEGKLLVSESLNRNKFNCIDMEQWLAYLCESASGTMVGRSTFVMISQHAHRIESKWIMDSESTIYDGHIYLITSPKYWK